MRSDMLWSLHRDWCDGGDVCVLLCRDSVCVCMRVCGCVRCVWERGEGRPEMTTGEMI